MLRRVTLSTASSLSTRPVAAPSSFLRTVAVAQLRTSTALFDDKYLEEQRAKKRQQMEESYSKDGKLPEVNPSSSFSPRRSESAGNLSTENKEELDRSAQDHAVRKPMNDDFADENATISDAKLTKKTLDVKDAPPLKSQRRNYSTDIPRIRKGYDKSIVSEGISGQGSKTRAKMNQSEHNQKYKTRGNFTEAKATADTEAGDHPVPEWSANSSSTRVSWVDSNSRKYRETSLSAEYNNKESSELDSLPHAPNSVNLGQFDAKFNGVQQKRGYATSGKKDAGTGNTKATLAWTDFLGEKPMEEDTKGTQAKKNNARFGEGWEKNLKESEYDFGSGSSGAPANNMRDKKPNQKNPEVAYSSERLETDEMAERGKLRDIDADAVARLTGQSQAENSFTNSMRNDANKPLVNDDAKK
eukprot:TRINITY_DN466_c0_g1_i1.p1 TRINITY_DN466_c0_g1~~TRINITY_DN466_c0_g1_i1.p1  ORF type:complete len:414 (+),score=86.06 TRINITY_DN466_c0_g1_i1:259-1500(+)